MTSLKVGDVVRLNEPSTSVSTIKFQGGESFVVRAIMGEGKWLALEPVTSCNHCRQNHVHMLAVQVSPQGHSSLHIPDEELPEPE
jgi:hypothetical protein